MCRNEERNNCNLMVGDYIDYIDLVEIFGYENFHTVNDYLIVCNECFRFVDIYSDLLEYVGHY